MEIELPESTKYVADPNEIENFDGFINFLNTNFLELSLSATHSINSEYRFLTDYAQLSSEEIKASLRWAGHNIQLAATFGFPTVLTYFVTANGTEAEMENVNCFHPAKITNLGNYLQYILLQLHTLYGYADQLDRNATTKFSDSVKQDLLTDPSLANVLHYGFIPPKDGIINGKSTRQINTVRMNRPNNLGYSEANWNLIGGYQAADISPDIFKDVNGNLELIDSKIAEVIEYANRNQEFPVIDIDTDTLISASRKIDEATFSDNPFCYNQYPAKIP